jgi:hypothetical protein
LPEASPAGRLFGLLRLQSPSLIAFGCGYGGLFFLILLRREFVGDVVLVDVAHAPATYLVDPKVVAPLADWHGRTALFAYYSYAQMLTIGYAAVTPLRAPATTLSLLSALFGPFYTAVIVSQVIGMMHTQRKKTQFKE